MKTQEPMAPISRADLGARSATAWRRVLAVAAVGLALSSGATAAEPRDKDLLPAARAALHGYMAKSVKPIPDKPGLVRANYYSKALPKPLLSDDQWDWGDCGARAVRAWLWMREMTGETEFGRETEAGLVRSLYHVLAPDTGMPCVPERSKAGDTYYELWDQGQTLRALVDLWRAQTDPAKKREARARVDKMIDGLSRSATRGRSAEFGAYAIYPFEGGPNRPRNTFNSILPTQFHLRDDYLAALRAAAADSFDNDWAAAKRLVGGWVALFMPNEWYCRQSPEVIEIYTAGCCSYSGPRALHACWQATLKDDGRLAEVRLPVNRQSAALSQTVTEGPDHVRQAITLHQTRQLMVRIPDWVDLRRVEVRNAKDRRVSFDVRGRWLDFGKTRKGARLLVRYPLTGRLDDSEAVLRRAWSMAVCGGRLFCGTLPAGRVRALEAGVAVSHDFELAPGWRHVVAVRAGNRLQLFVDGKCAATSAPFDPARFDLAAGAPLKIGFGEHDYFHGRLRDVRLYGRSLSDREVSRLFRKSK